jgi:hypothetical protein
VRDRFNSVILLGILICLILIAFKPVPSLSVNGQPVVNQIDPGTYVVSLGENKLAILDNRSNSGLFGTVLVFEYDNQRNTLSLKGKFNYADYFRNPQKYGIGMEQNTELSSEIDKKLDAIVSNPQHAGSSNPYEYIQDNADFDFIVKQGKHSLVYLLSKFGSSSTDGLKEYVMAIACSQILNDTNKNWKTGREWYNNYINVVQ